MDETKANIIYKVVKSIPKGKVSTYGDVARQTDTSPRYVGYVLHHNPNPAEIPCHRVVNSEGRLAKNFAFGGARGQANKLTLEGIFVQNDDKIDLEKYRLNF